MMHGRALVEPRATPALEGTLRRGDRAVDVGGRREGNLSRRFAAGGIIDGTAAVGGAVVPQAGDPVIVTEHGSLTPFVAYFDKQV